MASYSVLNDKCYRIIGEMSIVNLISYRQALIFAPISGSGSFVFNRADIWDATLTNCKGVGKIEFRPTVKAWGDLKQGHSSWGITKELCDDWKDLTAKDKGCWANVGVSRGTSWADILGSRKDWSDVPRDYIEAELEVPIGTDLSGLEINIEIPYTFA